MEEELNEFQGNNNSALSSLVKRFRCHFPRKSDKFLPSQNICATDLNGLRELVDFLETRSQTGSRNRTNASCEQPEESQSCVQTDIKTRNELYENH